jgi:hypothetical protein
MSNDLWPDFEANKVKIPKTLLVEQANFFNEKVKNVLTAKVTSNGSKDEKILHTFNISAPALGNYSFNLFHIRHEVLFYPLELIHKGGIIRVHDEAALLIELKRIFNLDETKRLVSSLYSQSI